MDIIDDANDLAAALAEDALAAVRANTPAGRPEAEEDAECDCGMPIGIKRYRLGYDTCISCAEWAEKSSKQFNRSKSRHYDDEY